jgi:hypothetical protein
MIVRNSSQRVVVPLQNYERGFIDGRNPRCGCLRDLRVGSARMRENNSEVNEDRKEQFKSAAHKLPGFLNNANKAIRSPALYLKLSAPESEL